MPHHKFYLGDVMNCLKQIPDNTVQCVVTSPPYWSLRDYGVDGQIGLEKSPEEFILKMVEVFREVKRVLRPAGTCWVNLGDSYIANKTGSNIQRNSKLEGGKDTQIEACKRPDKKSEYLKPKDLCGIPWRVALALQADGWFLRSDIIWSKPNAMPSSVTDRPGLAHEYLFLLTKKPRYYYDGEGIKEDVVNGDPNPPRGSAGVFGEVNAGRRKPDLRNGRIGAYQNRAICGEGDGTTPTSEASRDISKRNKRTVWEISTEGCPEAHFATFPRKLVEPCILAGTSPKACQICGAPWGRVNEPSEEYAKMLGKGYHDHSGDLTAGMSQPKKMPRTFADYITVDWVPTCKCVGNDGSGRCIVLDPFGGSGTVTLVASGLGRDSIYIDLNQDYLDIALQRNGFNGLCHADTYEIIRNHIDF